MLQSLHTTRGTPVSLLSLLDQLIGAVRIRAHVHTADADSFDGQFGYFCYAMIPAA